MAEKNNEINKNVDSSNIFNEFIDDTSLIEEVDRLKSENNKDLFFYISKIGHSLQILFWLLFFLFIILFSYVFLQNNENIKNSSLLDPFCWIFLWNIKNDWTYCSSIASLKASYLNKLNLLQKEQTRDILKNIETLYSVENFTKTKEVIFLNDKSENKLQVLAILEEFDNMKTDFNVEKQKIECKSLIIDSAKKILTMTCDSYSQWFEKGLRWLDWTTNNTLKWTSISQANSFLNFIEKTSETFEIVDRQKMFKEESILWTKTWFTSKTSFSLKLKYNLNK